MSHYSVLVMSYDPNDVEKLLEPFDEQPSDEYLEFLPVERPQEEIDATFAKELKSGKYKSYDEFMKNYYGYSWNEEACAYGYYCNPDAKWDWYVEGGRWPGMLKLKPEAVDKYPPLMVEGKEMRGFVNQALCKDVDFTKSKQAYDKALRFWEVVVEGGKLKDGEQERDFFSIFRPEYYTELYGSKEEYAESEAAFCTWALLTPEGDWYEPGCMGWFGMPNETKASRIAYETFFKEVLEKAEQDIYLTVVDCHI